jgi:hypothetical protein
MTTLIDVEVDGYPCVCSLQELLESTALDLSFVMQCVELELTEVRGSALEWRFGNAERLRLLKAWRLHCDLELHISALPLVLELLDEVEAHRAEIAALRSRLRHWETGEL